MSKAPMHPQMARIYMAAREAKKLAQDQGQTALAELINVAPQIVNNWEKRGPSKMGLLQFQNVVGINATWVETGIGPMLVVDEAHRSAREADERLQQIPAPTSHDVRVGPMTSMEVELVLAFRELGDWMKRKVHAQMMMDAENTNHRASSALAKVGIVAPIVTAARAAATLPPPPGGRAPDTAPGELDGLPASPKSNVP